MTTARERLSDPPVGVFKNRDNKPRVREEFFVGPGGNVWALTASICPRNGLSIWACEVWSGVRIQTCSMISVGSSLAFHTSRRLGKQYDPVLEHVAKVWWEIADAKGGCCWPDTLSETHTIGAGAIGRLLRD